MHSMKSVPLVCYSILMLKVLLRKMRDATEQKKQEELTGTVCLQAGYFLQTSLQLNRTNIGKTVKSFVKADNT